MCGLPRSGKTTYARQLQSDLKFENRKAIIISRDSIREMFHGGKHVFDLDLESLVEQSVYNTFSDAIHRLVIDDVIVDECCLRKIIREDYISRCKEHGNSVINNNNKITLIWCQNKNEKQLLRRCMKEPRGKSMVYWQKVLKSMSHFFESPTKAEGFYKIVKVK